MVEEMLAIRHEAYKDNVINDILMHHKTVWRKEVLDWIKLLDWTDYRYWTVGEVLDKHKNSYRQTS